VKSPVSQNKASFRGTGHLFKVIPKVLTRKDVKDNDCNFEADPPPDSDIDIEINVSSSWEENE